MGDYLNSKDFEELLTEQAENCPDIASQIANERIGVLLERIKTLEAEIENAVNIRGNKADDDWHTESWPYPRPPTHKAKLVRIEKL